MIWIWSALWTIGVLVTSSVLYGLIRAYLAYSRWVHWRDWHIHDTGKLARRLQRERER